MKDNSYKVLIGSPVRQDAVILKNFLLGLKKLETGSLGQVDFYFIDNNTAAESSQLLIDFAEESASAIICRFTDEKPYLTNGYTHIWEEELIWKVAGFKNKIIDKAVKDDYAYLFLVDSDLVLHPETLGHLISLQKDIVSEVFWTKWEPDFPKLPQVWVSDQYNLYENPSRENLNPEQILQRVQAFLEKLQVPGVYPVGGLGACTLISRNALLAGVNYKEIYNLSFVGEDRHFCIRAAALGFTLFADTHYPAFHLYRLSDLAGLADFQHKVKAKI